MFLSLSILLCFFSFGFNFLWHKSGNNGTENEMEVSSLSPSTTSSEPRHFDDEDDYLDEDLKDCKEEGDDEEEEEDIFREETQTKAGGPVERQEAGRRG